MIHEEPAKTSPRARRRLARIDAILSAAEAILVEEGLDGLTTQRLASEVDLTPGALYRYFASKDAIVAALVARLVVRLDKAFAGCESLTKAHAERANLAPRTASLLALLAAAELYRQRSLERPEQFHLVGITAGSPRVLVSDDVAQPMLGQVFSLFQRVGRLFFEAAEAGALTPGEDMERALLWWSSLQGLLQLRKLARFEGAIDVDRSQRQLARTLLVGWGASPGDIAVAEEALAELNVATALSALGAEEDS